MYIHLITGPMFAGKSSTLITQLEKYSLLAKYKTMKKIELFRPELDTRPFLTHNGKDYPSQKIQTLSEMDVSQYDVIGIDEVHFFPDLKEFVVRNEHMTVHIVMAGLNGDYLRRSFPAMLEIYPLVNEITLLTAFCEYCQDGTLAFFTKRLECDKTDDKIDTIVVGGDDKYIPLCRYCFIK